MFRAACSLFPSAEKRRWRRWHLSAPWRYSCCPAYLAAQVAAWPKLVSGAPLPLGRWCWGRKGVREVGIWPFQGLVATGGNLSSMGVVSWRPKHHTRVYPAARLLEETSLSAFGRAPKEAPCSLRSPVPAGKVICPWFLCQKVVVQEQCWQRGTNAFIRPGFSKRKLREGARTLQADQNKGTRQVR